MTSTPPTRPNHLLRRQRLLRGWTLDRVAKELCTLCQEEAHVPGVNADMISKWERGERKPSRFYQAKLCQLYGATADQLGLIGAYVIAGAMACGFFVIAWRFVRAPRWRGWVTYSLISGLLVLVFMAFFGAGQNPQNVFAGYAGLFERLATNIEPVWETVLLARLWTGTGLVRYNV